MVYDEKKNSTTNQVEAKSKGNTIGTPTALTMQSRTYYYIRDKFPVEVTLNKVIELIVRDSGSHRIRTESGALHYLTSDFYHIKVKDFSGLTSLGRPTILNEQSRTYYYVRDELPIKVVLINVSELIVEDSGSH